MIGRLSEDIMGKARVRPRARAKPKHKLYVIEVANNKKFLAAFPVLKSLQKAPKKRGCGRCGAGNNKRANVATSVKRTLAGMGSAQKQKLKDMLNAVRVRIVYRNERNKIVELTF
jgi:hypothetical protein